MTGLILSAILLLLPAERDSLLAEMETNSGFWVDVFKQYSGDTLSYIDHLFLTISAEDRETMNSTVLEDHLLGAINSRNNFYDFLPDSIFLNYLLPYRISTEPLSSYRSALGAWLGRRIQPEDTPLEMADAIRTVINHAITLTEAGSDAPPPTQTIPVGQASREGRWILLGASLRTMGIPARPVMGWFPGVDRNLYMWFDIWNGQEWLPLSAGMPPVQYVKAAVEYPSMKNITADYRDTGILLTAPLADFNEGEWSVDLLIPSGDDTTVINNLNLNPFRRNSVELGTGEFLLRVQFTRENEIVGTWLQNIEISADSTSVIDLTEAEYTIIPLPR